MYRPFSTMKERGTRQANKPPIHHKFLRQHCPPSPRKIPSASSKLLISRPTSCPPTLGEWQEEESYVEAAAESGGLRIVNDTAERGVALIQSFNLRLTKDEEQRQFLLQVVEAHRHQQPGTSKASLPRPSRPQ
ncbi:hypothetical protein GWK47_016871 [Chionoecetes opilio]|uniref:Uncharacterized protein n=1 Tax=Chionoecetes opilio TaxID=41210 RepID=A0A8J5CK15_CHIOP|nr:hypothetical protein GWK47_016871 [Chionoecetes opilio]